MVEYRLPIIENGNAEFVKFIEVSTGETRSIPPHPVSKIIYSYIFEITFTISFDGNSVVLDSLFGLACILPDYSILKFKIGTKNLVDLSENKIKCTFLLETKKKGWLKMMIASHEEIQSEGTPEFYQNKSNTLLIYLR